MEEKDITNDEAKQEAGTEEANAAEEKPENDNNEVEAKDKQEETAKEAEEIAELKASLEKATKEKEEFYERLLRLQAEFDNYKKRTLKEKQADQKYKAQELVTALLPVLDNFERALQVKATEETKSLLDGITMVYRQFLDALKEQGVSVIESVGKEFDPNFHHAVMQAEVEDKPSNTVIEELQKGYMLKDRVIRPAMVKVNK